MLPVSKKCNPGVLFLKPIKNISTVLSSNIMKMRMPFQTMFFNKSEVFEIAHVKLDWISSFEY